MYIYHLRKSTAHGRVATLTLRAGSNARYVHAAPADWHVDAHNPYPRILRTYANARRF